MSSMRGKEGIECFSGYAGLLFSSRQGFLDYYSRILASLGLVPVSRSTSERALAILRMIPVALVVVDEDLGISECLEVSQGARKRREGPPVLVISQNKNSPFRQEALAAGVTDYLVRPVLREDIIHALLPNVSRAKQSLEQSA